MVGSGECTVQTLAGHSHTTRDLVFVAVGGDVVEGILELGFVPLGFDVLVEEEEGDVVGFDVR